MPQAQLYKEDFDSERRDREKAHNLKEDMRLACDQKVHAMEVHVQACEETIQSLTRKLEGVSNAKEDLKSEQEIIATRSSTRRDVELKQLQDELFETRQKAITAQEEVQAKTVQVKQYKKKDDQREEKVCMSCTKKTLVYKCNEVTLTQIR